MGGRPGPADLRTVRLEDGPVSVTLLNYGAILQDWRIAHRGAEVPVVLGYPDPADYLDEPNHMGVIAGRVANRIGGAAFDLDGQTYALTANEGPHQLHGGPGGLGRQLWDLEPDGARAVRLRHVSPHGAEGYPGRVAFEVTVTLDGYRLTYDMRAVPDCPTPISLAQHAYYNLDGGGTVRDHVLSVRADRFTPVDGDLIATGEIAPIDGQAFDFRTPRAIGAADPEGRGFDINLLTDAGSEPVAEVRANRLHLRLWSDQPGLQLYTGQHLAGRGRLHDGMQPAAFCGLCLEPQGLPNAVNRAQFPSIIATPDRPYRQALSIEIAPDAGREG